MTEILAKTLPFFAIIGLGYGAARLRFFTEEATDWLTRFVFYFALSAMLFRFAANLPFAEVFDPRFVLAYLGGTGVTYVVVTAVGLGRGIGMAETAVEAQSAAIGNVGFLGIPMLTLLMGEAVIGPLMLVLAVDLIVFGSLIVILLTVARERRLSIGALGAVLRGLVSNPMIVAIATGLMWSSTGLGVAGPVNDFLVILGAAATPGALFAIGASLASKSAERASVALWLSFAKLGIHPAAVAVFALVLLRVEPFAAAVMIACAAMPVAGNVFIVARHYGVASRRVSAAILFSTALSIATVTGCIAWVSGFY